MKPFTPGAMPGIVKTSGYRTERASAPGITGGVTAGNKRGYMGEAAGRTAVVYDARADEFDEPLRVFVAGCPATGLRDRRRSRGNLRYSWLEDYLSRLDGKEARREYYSWLE